METAKLVQLLRLMAHDLRVPLNTVMSTSDMLGQGVYDSLTPKQTKAVTRLHRNHQRMLAMLDDFVLYVKAEAGELPLNPKPFNPQAQLKTWCNQVGSVVAEKGLSFHLSDSPDVPQVLIGDENLLGRIVMALLWNAVSFTAQGSIHVFSHWVADHDWLITVQDSGSGIPESDLPHIFEPFWRGEQRPQVPTAGAGLGLSLARACAQLMNGGTVFMKETSAHGSTFCVQIPMPQRVESIPI